MLKLSDVTSCVDHIRGHNIHPPERWNSVEWMAACKSCLRQKSVVLRLRHNYQIEEVSQKSQKDSHILTE